MDRFDVLAGLGVLAMIGGLLLIHPAWLLVAGGFVAVSNANRRTR